MRGGSGLIGSSGGLAIAGEQRAALGEQDLGRKLGIALGGARLPAKRRGAIVHVGEDFIQPGEIGLAGAQLLLGVAAADVKSGNARRFFQHGAALGRLGGNDGSDLALADQRRAVRTGGGVGEDERDVLGAHVAAIGAIGAARATLDAAHDFQLALGADVDGGDGLAGLLRREQADFGEVARRARAGAGEDHVVHAAAAHRPGAGFAHHPADRLKQVGLAAAIGAHDPGEPGLDAQFGGLYEALEAGQFEAADFHRSAVFPPRRRFSVRPPLSARGPGPANRSWRASRR